MPYVSTTLAEKVGHIKAPSIKDAGTIIVISKIKSSDYPKNLLTSEKA